MPIATSEHRRRPAHGADLMSKDVNGQQLLPNSSGVVLSRIW